MKNLSKAFLKSFVFWIGLITAVITIILVPPNWRPFVPLGLAVCIIIAVVSAANRIIQAKDEELANERQAWEQDRDELKRELAEAKRDKFSEDIGRQTEKFVKTLTPNEIRFFKALLPREDWNERSIVDSVPLQDQKSARDKACAARIMFNDEEKWHRCGRQNAFWRIYPEFIAPLKKYLYEPGPSGFATIKARPD